MTTRLCKLLMLTALLAACSYTPLQPSPPSSSPNYPLPPVENPTGEQTSKAPDTEEQEAPTRVAIATPESVNRARVRQQQNASDSLRTQAEAASAEGLYDKAERLLVRALRIAPRDAATYYQLALVKLQQDEPGRALQLAKKGLSLGPDAPLEMRLRQVEAQARTAD